MKSLVNSTKIQDIQRDIAKALEALPELDRNGKIPQELRPLVRFLAPPPGRTPVVDLRHLKKNGKIDRKVRETAGSENWNLSECGAIIRFQETGEVDSSNKKDSENESLVEKESETSRLEDLIRQLAVAERVQPQFVSIKWFRDTFLPGRGLDWVGEHGAAQAVLVEGFRRNWLWSEKVPNPRNPAFPTTAVRLNRDHPEVLKILRGEESDGWDFVPVEMPGEPLSATVMKSRR